MPIATIFDAIQLSGATPAVGDSLSTSGGDLVGVSDPIVFDTAIDHQINPGDTTEIGGVTYTVSSVTSYFVDATLQDGSVVETKMYSISLSDPDGNAIDFLINADPEAVGPAADLPLITNLEITDTAALPDDYVMVPLIDANDNVTLATDTAPTAVDDEASTDEDTPVTIDVLGNDTDPEGDPLVIEGTPTAENGTVTVNADGTLEYTPNPDFNGDDTITYEISDGNGGTDTAEVAVTVAPVNDAPDAVDDADTTPFNTAVVVDVLGNDTDPDGDTLSVVGTPTSDDGTVEVNDDGTITFTPNDGFTGDATINYEITDGNGGNDTAVVTVTVADNTDPVAVDDEASTDEDTPVTIDVLGNDTDPEGDPLVIEGTPTAENGTVTVNADGTLEYTPNPDFNGDDTITYEISDGNGGTDTAEVAVTVAPVNDAPDAVDDADTTPFNTAVVVDVLGNDTDPDGDTLSVVGTPTSDDGTVEVNDDGTITFTPNDGFTGDATINYEITDGNGGNDTAVVTVTVGDDPQDGIVSGTDGGDLIDTDYTGDPDGDLVDNEDAILPGEAPNDDIIEAGAGDDVVIAGLGDDDVYGGTGDDELSGNGGDDILRGEDGDDVLDGGDGDDTLLGGAGDDDIQGGYGNDTVDGGDGDDVIDTSGSDPLPDIAYPGLYEADDDPFDDRDVVNGGAGNDTITTGDDVDIIDGGTGNDIINAGIDDDIIDGGDGNDYIIGGEGNDEIDGGAGDDIIYAGAGPGVPSAINIPDDGSGSFGPDLVPNNGMDVIHGGDGNDTIYGEDDDDTLFGDAGDDTLYGGIDDDTLDGGTGNDTLSGGQGNDTMSGGDDRDTFIDVTAGDVIDGNEGGDDYDTLDLTGAAPEGGSLNVEYDPDNNENGTVTFRDADGTITGTTTFENIENVVPCFVSGTRIKTTAGEVAVEDLEVGQLVLTMDHGLQPIRWIGSARRAATGDLAPIRIRKGTLGNDRDLWVSPQHRMLMTGPETVMMFGETEVLATAKSLLNDYSITRVEGGEVEYFHVMFDSHEIVYAEGAPSESFHPGEQGFKALDQATRDEILELFPELASDGFKSYGPSARLSLKAHEAAILKTK